MVVHFVLWSLFKSVRLCVLIGARCGANFEEGTLIPTGELLRPERLMSIPLLCGKPRTAVFVLHNVEWSSNHRRFRRNVVELWPNTSHNRRMIAELESRSIADLFCRELSSNKRRSVVERGFRTKTRKIRISPHREVLARNVSCFDRPAPGPEGAGGGSNLHAAGQATRFGEIRCVFEFSMFSFPKFRGCPTNG